MQYNIQIFVISNIFITYSLCWSLCLSFYISVFRAEIYVRITSLINLSFKRLVLIHGNYVSHKYFLKSPYRNSATDYEDTWYDGNDLEPTNHSNPGIAHIHAKKQIWCDKYLFTGWYPWTVHVNPVSYTHLDVYKRQVSEFRATFWSSCLVALPKWGVCSIAGRFSAVVLLSLIHIYFFLC